MRVESLPEFDRRFKRLQKKFRTLTTELAGLAEQLTTGTRLGQRLGGGLYKIRLSSASKGGGKSGGFRIITYYVEPTADGDIVYLVTIYDKSEEASINKADLLTQIGRSLPE